MFHTKLLSHKEVSSPLQIHKESKGIISIHQPDMLTVILQ